MKRASAQGWRTAFAAAALIAAFLSGPFSARAFDCLAPPFGASLSAIEGREMLVKYAQNKDVAYYRYEGPCGYAAPANISYAFVEDVLFARIVEMRDVDFRSIRSLAPEAYGREPRETREGDWLILTWNFRERGIKLKMKYDEKSGRLKSALYYEPLRERIRALDAQREIFKALIEP